jgi:hypothetical protein
MWPLYGTCRSRHVFAADASAASTLPTFVVKRAGSGVFVSPPPQPAQKLPELGSFGSLFHVTLSCAAAWIASYSFGATTRGSSLTHDLTPGMCLIEFSSTADGWVCRRRTRPGRAGGRRGRAASRDADVVHVRVLAGDLAGMSMRGKRVPTSLYGRPASRGATPGCSVAGHRDVEQLAAEQLAVRDGLAAAETTPLLRVRLADRTPAASGPCRAALRAAPRRRAHRQARVRIAVLPPRRSRSREVRARVGSWSQDDVRALRRRIAMNRGAP